MQGELPRDVRKTYLAAIRLRAFQPLDPDGEANEASGWCVLDRPFDLELGAENVFNDRFVLLGFRIDRFRVPPAMVRAELAEQEQRLLARSGKSRVSRNERLELRDKIVRRIRRKLAPSTRALDVVWDLDAGVVLFFSHSKRVIGDFTALFELTFKLELTEESPYTAAERAKLPRVLSRALSTVAPLNLTTARKSRESAGRAGADDKASREPAEVDGAAEATSEDEEEDELFRRVESTRFLGPEFLLWIWLRTEYANKSLELGEGPEYEVWLDHQLTLESPLDKNERVTVRGLAPADSAEAREAVRERKLPVRARLVLQSGARDFSTGLDAPRFAIAGAKVPGVLGSDADEAFLERMNLVGHLFGALDALYRIFLEVRLSEAWSQGWEPVISAWAEGASPPTHALAKIASGAERSRPAKKRARAEA